MQSLEMLADREANLLGAEMETQSRVVSDAEARLDDLQTYFDSFHERDPGGKVVAAVNLRETQVFLDKLAEAVEGQRQIVERARSALEAVRARWIAKRLRTTALGNAVHRFKTDEVRLSLQREQRAHDEHAARRFADRSADNAKGHPGSKR